MIGLKTFDKKRLNPFIKVIKEGNYQYLLLILFRSRTLRWKDEDKRRLDLTIDQKANVIKANICPVA